MKLTKPPRSLALTAAFAAVFLTEPALANTTPQETPVGMPKTPEEWVQYLSNFTQNADMLVDPKKFVAALSAVTEPQFAVAALGAMMNPNLYMQSVATLMDPRAYANYARTMDPKTLADWTQALMDPQFYTALTYVFTDPNKLYRWLMAPLDPKVMSLALNMLNPNIYLRWGTTGLDPRLWNMLSAGLNPNWYAAWLNTLTNPGSYGPSVGGWMQTPYGGTLAPYPLPGMPAYPYQLPMPTPRP
jgi:hypothetical protein